MLRVYLDGNLIGSSTSVTMTLGAIKANAYCLGRGPSGGYFDGQFYDMAVYRKAISSFTLFISPSSGS